MPSQGVLGTTSPIINAYTGSRAEQVIRGVTAMASQRSWADSMLRVLITAGMAQAVPLTRGTMDLPLNPKGRMNRSIIKTTRAM